MWASSMRVKKGVKCAFEVVGASSALCARRWVSAGWAESSFGRGEGRRDGTGECELPLVIESIERCGIFG